MNQLASNQSGVGQEIRTFWTESQPVALTTSSQLGELEATRLFLNPAAPFHWIYVAGTVGTGEIRMDLILRRKSQGRIEQVRVPVNIRNGTTTTNIAPGFSFVSFTQSGALGSTINSARWYRNIAGAVVSTTPPLYLPFSADEIVIELKGITVALEFSIAVLSMNVHLAV